MVPLSQKNKISLQIRLANFEHSIARLFLAITLRNAVESRIVKITVKTLKNGQHQVPKKKS